jgi:hypothetical protein
LRGHGDEKFHVAAHCLVEYLEQFLCQGRG